MTDITNDDFVPAKPAGFSGNNGGGSGEPRNYPVPKGGSRRARISLIVDLGTQIREDSYKTEDGKMCNSDTAGAIATPQKPAKQVVVFADLVSDIVDYGGDIGKQQYRLMLNGSFSGVVKGVNHAVNTPTRDNKGNIVKGAPWNMHPLNLLTKLSKATGMEEVIANGAINRLLNKQFMATVDVNEKNSGKVGTDGEPIIYRNVNFKGAAQVATVETGEEDEEGNSIEAVPEFAQLKTPALCITFANAKKENIKFIRRDVLKMIKLATDYAGSNMQKAVEAYEAEANTASGDDDGEEEEAVVAVVKPVVKPVVKKKPIVFEDDSNESPF